MNITHWGLIDGYDVAKELGIERFILLNDFQCAAFAINMLTDDDLVCIRKGTSNDPSLKVIVGLGTGLGVSFAIMSEKGIYVPNPSEAGWMHFLEASEQDHDLVKYLKVKLNTEIISFEHVCSGTALSHIYNFLKSKIRDLEPDMSPKEICGKYDSCGICRRSVDLMLEYLGRFLVQMSLIFKPTGGFFLTGGAMDSLFQLIHRSDSFERGLGIQKHPILLQIARGPSIYYIRRPDMGLFGAQSAAAAFF